MDKKIEDMYLEILKNKTNKNPDIKYIFMKVNGKITDAQVKLSVIKYIMWYILFIKISFHINITNPVGWATK